eukprot:2105392-Pleurochrysis_carterae.AAC.3
MLKPSNALKDTPPGSIWHLAAPKRAAPQGSGAGRHSAHAPCQTKRHFLTSVLLLTLGYNYCVT